LALPVAGNFGPRGRGRSDILHSRRPVGTTLALATSVQATPRADVSLEGDQIPYPEVPRISASEAKARYDTGTTLFVDVRAQEEYDTAHIPNAILLPMADLEARYQELPQDAEIITY